MLCRQIVFLYIGSLFCLQPAYASTEDTQQPIIIEADQAVLDEKNQTSTYTGNVVLKQGGIEVKANIITVYARKGQLQKVIAEGDPVHYRQQQQTEDIHGVCQRMEYETESKSVLLLDGAELWQGGNRFSGSRILYDPRQEKVIASSSPDESKQDGQRVQIILQPKSPDRKEHVQEQDLQVKP
jgi:lipopolysaccharide export system protein LptA